MQFLIFSVNQPCELLFFTLGESFLFRPFLAMNKYMEEYDDSSLAYFICTFHESTHSFASKVAVEEFLCVSVLVCLGVVYCGSYCPYSCLNLRLRQISLSNIRRVFYYIVEFSSRWYLHAWERACVSTCSLSSFPSIAAEIFPMFTLLTTKSCGTCAKREGRCGGWLVVEETATSPKSC